MRLILIPVCVIIMSFTCSYAQNVDWILGDNGQTNPPGKNIGAISHDSANHIFIAGVFSNSFSLSNSTALTTRGMNDVYLVSMNSDSTVNWTKQIGGAGNENFNGALSLDYWGNIYIAGSFGDSMWIDGQYLLHTGPSAPGFRSDVFMAKFTPAGNLVWLKQTKGNDIEFATDIAVDSSGNVFLSGQFDHDTDFGDGIFVDNTGESDAFVCKYDVSGTLVWKKICQSTDWSHEDITNIEASADGYAYVAGFYYDSTTTFDNLPLQHAYMGGQSFVAAIAPSGTVSWIKYLESPNGGSFIEAMKLRNNNLYVAGNFNGYLTIAPTFVIAYGGMDIFLTALNPANGNAVWAKRYGTSGTQKMVRHGFQAGLKGNLYFVGNLEDSTRFDSLKVTSTAFQDIYVAVCDSNGVTKFLHKATGTGDQIADAIDVDSSGKIYISGVSLSGSISFGNKSLSSPHAGIFMAKFTPFNIPLSVSAANYDVLRLYPNPAENFLSWSDPKSGKLISISIYDMRGAIVFSQHKPSSNSIDISKLSSGSYLLQMDTEKEMIRQVIIKK